MRSTRGTTTRRLTAGATALVLLAGASSATAAPPASNPNAETLEITCDGGVTFTVRGIANANGPGLVISGVDARVFVITGFTVDGEVGLAPPPGVRNANQQHVTGCTSPQLPAGVVGEGLLVP
jgi:hypothetical protein